MVHPEKGRENSPVCTFLETTPENAKVISIVCDKVMEKMKKWLNLGFQLIEKVQDMTLSLG